MSNIVKFDEYTGKVFGTLYEAFPIPVDLSIKGITGESSASASSRYPPINPDKLNTSQAVEMKIATNIAENERPTTTQRIRASFIMLSDIFTP
ncbi:hypothetical protein ABGK91_004475 [Escherichia albertii]|nr:hypothetical protein [Escherichia albertii]